MAGVELGRGCRLPFLIGRRCTTHARTLAVSSQTITAFKNGRTSLPDCCSSYRGYRGGVTATWGTGPRRRLPFRRKRAPMNETQTRGTHAPVSRHAKARIGVRIKPQKVRETARHNNHNIGPYPIEVPCTQYYISRSGRPNSRGRKCPNTVDLRSTSLCS